MATKIADGFEVACADAAEIIGIAKSTLSRQARLGLIPSRRRGIGRNAKYFFREKDVEYRRKLYREGIDVSAG